MLHLHWYREVKPGGPEEPDPLPMPMDVYLQCRCGRRKWRPLIRGGYWPVDKAWLCGEGERPWDRSMPPPRPPRDPRADKPLQDGCPYCGNTGMVKIATTDLRTGQAAITRQACPMHPPQS
jgi:hypothetical protein